MSNPVKFPSGSMRECLIVVLNIIFKGGSNLVEMRGNTGKLGMNWDSKK